MYILSGYMYLGKHRTLWMVEAQATPRGPHPRSLQSSALNPQVVVNPGDRATRQRNFRSLHCPSGPWGVPMAAVDATKATATVRVLSRLPERLVLRVPVRVPLRVLLVSGLH